MPITRKLFKNALSNAINENGFTILFEGEDDYYLVQKDVESETISMQLILPDKVEISKQSDDQNDITSMNYLNLHVPIGEKYPDFFILALDNAGANRPEFIIIPFIPLYEKLFYLGIALVRKVCLSFIVYSDGKAFNITSLSYEGRWFLLGKGLRGRMADGSVFDFSGWLNNWNVLSQ